MLEQPTQALPTCNLARARWAATVRFNRPGQRRIAEALMWAFQMIIFQKLRQQIAQMRLSQGATRFTFHLLRLTLQTMRILALDVGTSSVKAAVLDTDTGEHAGFNRVGYELDSPAPEAEEVPAERIWAAVVAAARAATLREPEVEAVGLSVMTPALVLLDQADRPCAPIWTHLDRRARPAARHVWAAVGEEFLATTGNRPLPGGISVLGYRQRLQDDPYLAQRVKSYLHLNGWLGLHMTGERAFDPANASFTGLFGTMTDRAWSPRWCEYFEVEPRWLPPVRDGSATLGAIRAGVSGELGVAAGIPLKLGTADTSCAMLSAGMKAGDLLHEVGTTQVLAVFAGKPRPSPKRLTRLFGVGDGYVYVTHNPVGGVALDWLHRLCFRDQSAEEFFDKTIALAQKHRTRVSLDPPYLGGDRLEIEAHRAAFRDLLLTSDRLDLLAALLEALVRRHREALAALDQGERFGRIFLSGGGAEVVHRLIPEYASAQVHLVEEASLHGVALLFEPRKVQ
jgi:xylulokinase